MDREGPIQRAIVQFLRLKYPRAFLFSVPNELASRAGGERNDASRSAAIARAQANAKQLGMLSGAPDLIMLHGARVYAFEVKAEGGRQSAAQKAAQAACEANGGTYAVVRSIEDVKEVLAKHPPRWVPIVGKVS